MRQTSTRSISDALRCYTLGTSYTLIALLEDDGYWESSEKSDMLVPNVLVSDTVSSLSGPLSSGSSSELRSSMGAGFFGCLFRKEACDSARFSGGCLASYPAVGTCYFPSLAVFVTRRFIRTLSIITAPARFTQFLTYQPPQSTSTRRPPGRFLAAVLMVLII